jgi:hypothetical protein
MMTADKAARQRARDLLESRDWSDGEVVTGRRATIVHSTRLPAEWSATLEAEAQRRGTNPSQLMKDLLIAALRHMKDEQPVTLTRGELHALIDSYLDRRAA